MDLWAFVQNNAVALLSVILTGVGGYFGARSFFLAKEKKQEEEIGKIKQLLVGSSEVSVQNLTQVIESLRSRVDRLESERTRLREENERQREREEKLIDQREKLREENREIRQHVTVLKAQVSGLQQVMEKAGFEHDLASLGLSESDLSAPDFGDLEGSGDESDGEDESDRT